MVAIRPLLLVSGHNVALKIVEALEGRQAIDAPAFVEKKTNGYDIVIQMKHTKSLYKTGWLAKSGVTIDQFVIALQLHEVAHILFESLDTRWQSPLLSHIDNVIEDARIEYHLTMNYPMYAGYIRYALTALRRHFDVQSKAVVGTKLRDQQDQLNSFLSTLFAITRFGTISSEDDEGFVNFVVPMVLSATRGDRKNCIEVVKAVHSYIMRRTLIPFNQITGAKETKVAVTKSELDQLSHGDQVMANISPDVQTQAAGRSDDEIVVDEKDDWFYRSVVEKYGDTVIADLRRLFKLRFEQSVFSRSFDGELSVTRQMDAYIDSITGDTGRNYLQHLPQRQSLDLVICRDISGSTEFFMNDYATAMVCLAAAVSGLQGVRLSVIDFNWKHYVNVKFDEKLSHGKLYPQSKGGTSLTSALNELAAFEWKGGTRVCTIVTDGGIDDFRKAQATMALLTRTHRIHFGLFDIGRGNSISTNGGTDTDVVCCSLSELPAAISRKIFAYLA